MVDSVVDLDIGDFVWVNTLQTTDIETIFLWIGSPLMMRVDSTDRAKEVACHFSIEPILAQKLHTRYDF